MTLLRRVNGVYVYYSRFIIRDKMLCTVESPSADKANNLKHLCLKVLPLFVSRMLYKAWYTVISPLFRKLI
jgi:hypothetical protein